MAQEEKKDPSADIQAQAKKEVLKELEDSGVISYMRAKIKKSVIDILDKQSENTKQKLEFDFMTPLHRLNKSKEIILAGHLIKQFLEYYKLEYTLPIFENESNIHEKIKKESLASEFNLKDSKDKDIPILVQIILEYQTMKKRLETYQNTGFGGGSYGRLMNGGGGYQSKTAEDRFSNSSNEPGTLVPNRRLSPISMTNNSVEINHNDDEIDGNKFSTFNINPALMRPKSEPKEVTANDILNKGKSGSDSGPKKDLVIGDDDKLKNSNDFKRDEIGGESKVTDEEFVEEKLEFTSPTPKDDKDESHDSFKASGGYDVSASKTGNEFDYSESAEPPKSI